MSMTPWLTAAGKYAVEHIVCPHFSQPSLLDGPRTGVLHTTEGGWDGSMGVFHAHFAPQFIVGYNAHFVARKRLGTPTPKPPTGNVEIAQLVPLGTIGAALVTHNNVAIAQIEAVAFSKEEEWVFDEATLDAVSSLMVELEKECGIPLSRPWPDTVWGLAGKTTHRNDGHFGKTAGWYGHGDCPSPDTHWDPGHLNWSAVFAKAKSIKGSA